MATDDLATAYRETASLLEKYLETDPEKAVVSLWRLEKKYEKLRGVYDSAIKKSRKYKPEWLTAKRKIVELKKENQELRGQLKKKNSELNRYVARVERFLGKVEKESERIKTKIDEPNDMED